MAIPASTRERRSREQLVDVELVSPLPISWCPDVWGWLQVDPTANFDDYGPQNQEQFANECQRRFQSEWIWGVAVDGQRAGAVGAVSMTPRLVSLHGIVFRESVRGTGAAHIGVSKVLDVLWNNGVEKVIASYFSDNMRVHSFLKKLGAVEEGYLKAHTIRNGEPIDMRLVAWFRED